MQAVTTEPATFCGRSCKKHLGWIRNRHQPCAGHFKDANLIRSTKAILGGPHDAMVVMSFAFEIEDRIDDMLQRLWSGDRTVFGDVADKENRDRAVLCQQQELVSYFPHLRNRAGRRFYQRRENRLDGIDDDRAGIQAVYFVEDVLKIGLGQQIQIVSFNSQSLAAQFYLPLRLLSRNIKYDCATGAQPVRHLQQQSALADARIPANQHQRSRHDAAAQHAIEFSHTGSNAHVVLRFNLAVGDCLNVS